MANQTDKILMVKKSFMFVPFCEDLAAKGECVVVTPDMMRFVGKNPKANGPKVLLFLAKAQIDAAADFGQFAEDVLRKEQAAQDAGGLKYEPPVASTPPVAPPVTESPVTKVDEPVGDVPPVTVPEGAKDGIAAIRTMLEAKTDKAEVLDYAEKALGIKLDVHRATGVKKIIAMIIAELVKKNSEQPA